MSIMGSDTTDLDHARSIKAPTDADLDAFTPLEERVRRLLKTIPASVQRAGLPIETLRVRLKGRLGRGVSIAELAPIMRRLGYIPHRLWHLQQNERGAVSLWYPIGYGPELPPEPKRRRPPRNRFKNLPA